MLKIRNILIILGVFFLLKFIGKVMRGRREAQERERTQKRNKAVQNRKEFIRENEGRVFVIPKDAKMDETDIEDSTYEEIKD